MHSNMLNNTKFHCSSVGLWACGPLLGPTVALALIEINPTLLQSPLQGLSRLLPAGTSPLPPPGLRFSHRYLSWLAPPVIL